MSYILEALKKAQAERQLGATPTIHAPTLDGIATRETPAAPWKPLALAAGAIAVVGVAALLWRQHETPPAVAATASTASTAPPAAAQPAAPAVVAVRSVSPAPATMPPAPARPAVPPAAAPVPAPAPASAPAPAAAAAAAASVPMPAVVAATVPPTPAHKPAPEAAKSAKVAAVEPQEEPAQLRSELPEPIQRSIPPIAMGGYMYSKNPADRLLLIDKVLRHEGEEVAPGLVLEKLQPKAAVFTFKGYRYRVPY
jgi:general secretion pathway protein B